MAVVLQLELDFVALKAGAGASTVKLMLVKMSHVTKMMSLRVTNIERKISKCC